MAPISNAITPTTTTVQHDHRRLIFAVTLFLSGIMSMTAFILKFVDSGPWSFNGITGFHGFLLGTGLTWFFAFTLLLTAFGLLLLVMEAFQSSFVRLSAYLATKPEDEMLDDIKD